MRRLESVGSLAIAHMPTSFHTIRRTADRIQADIEVADRARKDRDKAEAALADAFLANYRHPSRPTRRLLYGHVSFVGKVKHLSVGDMIDTPTVKAVETEMYRRGIGDLWGTQLSNEIIEAARASLVRRDGPYEATTPEEAARLAVGAVIDAGEHEAERREMVVAQMIDLEGRVAAW